MVHYYEKVKILLMIRFSGILIKFLEFLFTYSRNLIFLFNN